MRSIFTHLSLDGLLADSSQVSALPVLWDPFISATSFQLLCWKVSCRHPSAQQGYYLADPSYHIDQQGPDYTLHPLPSTCL